LNNFFSTKPLVVLGRLSYSIYLFHWLSRAVFLYLGLQERTPAWIIGNVLLTGLLAYVSYYGVELKFVALRKRFGSFVPAKKEAQSLQL
jgi:peptidoglycan/LPS O-acetylase OafA/YrhL